VPAAPRQLPAATQGFVGRTTQMDALMRLLDDPVGERSAARISAITGTAGVGKSALALHWAQRVQDRFPDGQLYIDLRGYDPDPPVTPEQALDGFLRAFGVPGDRIPAGIEALSGLYQSLLAGRRVLMVLDNAATAEQVFPLLAGAAGCAVVVTSRGRLSGLVARDGVQPLALGLLSPEEASALLRQSIGTERVDAEPDAAVQLAQQCAHLPLALRIAADRVVTRPGVTLRSLVEELADERGRLDVLAADDDQTTGLRAAFSWSYRALPPEAARVFRLLGLHAGPDISVPAVAALTGTTPAQVRGLLDVLTSAHLLEETARDRYRFHDLLRLYATERATEASRSQRAAAIGRVLTWYLYTADTAVRAFSPLRLRVPLGAPGPGVAIAPLAFTSPAVALGWFEAERANLVAATRHAAECGEHVLAWKLPAVLWDFFSLHGHWTDWLTTHEIGLAAARRLGDRLGEAWLENNLGNAYRGLGQFEEAVRHLQRALDINRETGNRPGEGWTRYNLGDTYRELGRFQEALNQLRQSLVISREVGERWSEGYTQNMIGDIYRSLGQHEEALRHLLPALVTNRQIDHRRGEGISLDMIGDTYQQLGRLDQALNYYLQALALRREIGDRRGEGSALQGLGATYQKRRRFDQALNNYQQALAVRREIGDRLGEARTLSSLARVLQHTGRLDAAREYWRRALTIFDDLGDPQAVQVRTSLNSLGADIDDGVGSDQR
jgi:tetratricopeptide (TPR) repeat protein